MRYILLSSVKNEEKYISHTIKAVISQTCKPQKWIIVNDGSKDATENIIKEFQKEYSFIQLIQIQDRGSRNFSSKVFALTYAYQNLENIRYDFIGILDGDITLPPNYYEIMFSKFIQNPKLGIAGGEFYDVHKHKEYKIHPSPNSVRGGVQLFRRECYEDIGGLSPFRYGGEDTVAEVSARMYGWEVKTFSDVTARHHRITGTAITSKAQATYRQGMIEFTLGYHPLFEIIKCIKRLNENPVMIGSICRFLGYSISALIRRKKEVTNDFVEFLRKEQIDRVKSVLFFKNQHSH